MNINYIEGDATSPVGDGNKIIVHCCNDIGVWGAGFVLALSAKWSDPENGYKQWHANDAVADEKGVRRLTLGEVQFVPAEAGIEVANIIGQYGVGSKGGAKPIRYPAIKKGLKQVARRAHDLNATVHAPRFGAGLAGGDWNKIEEIIQKELVEQGVTVVIYDLPTK